MKTFWIALKRKGSGKLLWIKIKAGNEKTATTKAHEREADEFGYTLYAGPLLN